MSAVEVRLRSASVSVSAGPALLAGLLAGPGLGPHEACHGPLRTPGLRDLLALTEVVPVLGRGGARFPFARKLDRTARGRGRAVVVVNLSEGEPASLKDAVLAQVAPHLVLDGVAATAHALGTGEVHLVLPSALPEVGQAVRRALGERAGGHDHRLRYTLHVADDAFVAGQSSAVLELMAGRPNLPVTTWRPSAESGHRGRPTLLSNAETFAHVGLLVTRGPDRVRTQGTRAEPGTTLLTIGGDGPAPAVVEVPFGAPWSSVLEDHQLDGPVLLGGYHGSWTPPGALRHLAVSPLTLGRQGLDLGAGVVLPRDDTLGGGCPVERTADLVAYLAAESAGRCGPCFNGLPALAAALDGVRRGTLGLGRVQHLVGVVDGRGACAHPDGTVRLVRSLLAACGEELAVHVRGGCGVRVAAVGRGEGRA